MILPGIRMKEAVNIVARYYGVTKKVARRRILDSFHLGWLDSDVAADIQLMARHFEYLRDTRLPDVCVGFVRWFHGYRPGEHDWSYDDELHFQCSRVKSCTDCGLYPVECWLKSANTEAKKKNDEVPTYGDRVYVYELLDGCTEHWGEIENMLIEADIWLINLDDGNAVELRRKDFKVVRGV